MKLALYSGSAFESVLDPFKIGRRHLRQVVKRKKCRLFRLGAWHRGAGYDRKRKDGRFFREPIDRKIMTDQRFDFDS